MSPAGFSLTRGETEDVLVEPLRARSRSAAGTFAVTLLSLSMLTPQGRWVPEPLLSQPTPTVGPVKVRGVSPRRTPSRAPSRTHSTPSPAVGPCAISSRLSTLLVAVLGRSGAIRTKRGQRLRRTGRPARRGTPRARPGQRGVVLQHDRGHHLVADVGVGDGVDGDPVDRGQPLEDPLDRRGGEVLAVDAHPVGGAAGEVDRSRRRRGRRGRRTSTCRARIRSSLAAWSL